MSVLGVDVGSSAVKVAAYGAATRTASGALAVVREPLTARHPEPGCWELDPEQVWAATEAALHQVASDPAVRADPPVALAVSASGREVFPVDAGGDALGPCLMAGDARGADLVEAVAGRATPEEWLARCGHVPERMDPVVRTLWWRTHHPDVLGAARWMLGWHEFLTLRLGGEPVVDPSLAGRWLAYDLPGGRWSPGLLEELGVDAGLLPPIGAWGTVAATLIPACAAELGLSAGLPIAVGGFDASCAALGAGVAAPGPVSLACGSWLALVAPVAEPAAPARLRTLLGAGVAVEPHPGATRTAAFALNPNGATVLDWAAGLTGASLDELESRLDQAGGRPSPVAARARLTPPGGPPAARGPERGGGALLGLTLATSPRDVVAALAEAVGYEVVLAAEALECAGAPVELLRVSGGGARSAWWTQLFADLTGRPLEVVGGEPGTRGAARLAALAADPATAAALAQRVPVTRRHDPNPRRRELHADRLDAYRAAVTAGDVPAADSQGGRS